MRYFLEVSYKGTNYSGFQTQKNANTIQAEIEKALQIVLRTRVDLTGSSRTDAGVHALQNFYHFDVENDLSSKLIYNLNAVLPPDIAAKKLWEVEGEAHCRFDAISREYKYFIYNKKDPFLNERAFYFPYTLDIRVMQEAATLLQGYTDFTSFSKRNTQVKTFECRITESKWMIEGECLVYQVAADRFLRGMVRALTATMLKLGRGKMDMAMFRKIVESKDSSLANFAAPSHGLFLVQVLYPGTIFK